MSKDNLSISNHYWEHVFTAENIIEYGRAAKDLAYYLRVLFLDGYDSIVIPSRGAVPLFRAAQHAWHYEIRNLQSSEDRFLSKIEMLGSPMHAVTMLPFSADPDEEKQTSKGIRTFWVKVLSALVRRDGRDPHLIFYQKIVEHLQKIELTSVLPRNLPSSKFIFIDTVISGRAVVEILDALEAEGLNECHLILLIDEGGKRIQGEYKRKIDALVASQRCTTIPLSNLWTEDRGPSVSGVWSTVYPQVLAKLQGRYSWSQDVYGAGSYYHKVSSSQVSLEKGIGSSQYNMPITILYGSVSTMISQVVGVLQTIESLLRYRKEFASGTEGENLPLVTSEEIESKHLSHLVRSLEWSLSILKEDLNELIKFSPLEQETTIALSRPRIEELYSDANVTATSSHLVRVELPLNVVDDLFSDFDRAMRNLTHSALSDDWFLHKNDWGAESKKFIDKYKESKTPNSNECDGSSGKCSEAE